MHILRKTSFWTGFIVAGALGIVVAAYVFDPVLSEKAREYTSNEVRWYCLLPPLLAVVLSLLFRRVILALVASIVVGVGLLHGFNPVVLVRRTAVDYLWQNFANRFAILFVVFVFALIGMIGVINRSGGTQGVIDLFRKMVRSARRACLAAIGMGLAIFFDDFTNVVIVGSTMRNLMDSLKVSREKLAYIADSTAAPVAGLAVISTWIGYEVEQLQHVANSLNIGASGYSIFFGMIPMRFYCIFTIVFVILNSLLRRDFGPMLRAERRAIATGEIFDREDDTLLTIDFAEHLPKDGVPHRWYNAVVPVIVVILASLVGILIGGAFSPAMRGVTWSLFEWKTWYFSFVGIGQMDNGIPLVLCAAALLGSVVTFVMVFSQRLLTPKEMVKAWFHGWRIIFVIAAFLVMAWTIRQVCDELGVAYFVIAAAKGKVSAYMIPLITFLISSAIAFSTGTSWGTMAIMIPMMAPLSYEMGGLPIFTISMAAILDGSIFGDHCSPISDTTVLSSISAGSDHIDHVKTQLPYAVVTMLIAAVAGYIPIAFGVPIAASYVAGAALVIGVLLIFGRRCGVGT